MNISTLGLGKVVAVIAFILAVVFLAVGRMSLIEGGLFALVSVAILLL